MKQAVIVLALCLFLPALTCHATEGGAPAVKVEEGAAWYRADRHLTVNDFGRTVTLRVGSLVDVTLDENMSTGYMWHCNPTAGLLLLRNIAVGPVQQVPGAGGARHYLLLASRTGTSKLTLQYGRWWQHGERDTPKTITVNVTAK